MRQTGLPADRVRAGGMTYSNAAAAARIRDAPRRATRPAQEKPCAGDVRTSPTPCHEVTQTAQRAQKPPPSDSTQMRTKYEQIRCQSRPPCQGIFATGPPRSDRTREFETYIRWPHCPEYSYATKIARERAWYFVFCFMIFLWSIQPCGPHAT